MLNQLADLTMQVHVLPSQATPAGSQIKSRVKKRPPSEPGLKNTKRSPLTDQKPATNEAAVEQNNANQTPKKSDFSEVTLSALNSPELDVDIEDLEDNSPAGKKLKLAFESDIDTSLL